ncbi:MAG: hypothetical protein KDB94_07115 [Acidobacteria bacterium]|nr:hypothetical protein [Acidobacteriota bacterium]
MNWTKKDKAHAKWVAGLLIKLLLCVTSVGVLAKITPETTWAELLNPFFAVPALGNVAVLLWGIFSKRWGDIAEDFGD